MHSHPIIYALAYFDPNKYIYYSTNFDLLHTFLLHNFFLLQIAKTLNFALFCTWKNEKKINSKVEYFSKIAKILRNTKNSQVCRSRQFKTQNSNSIFNVYYTWYKFLAACNVLRFHLNFAHLKREVSESLLLRKKS